MKVVDGFNGTVMQMRSRMAEATVTSAKTSFHWEKVLLEVKMVDVFSYRLAMSWKNGFAPWISKGKINHFALLRQNIFCVHRLF